MTECRTNAVALQLPTPQTLKRGAFSPKQAAAAYDEDMENDENRQTQRSAQERLLRSPTDKLLSPVSRALKAHHKRSPTRVRKSLTSLLDVAL